MKDVKYFASNIICLAAKTLDESDGKSSEKSDEQLANELLVNTEENVEYENKVIDSSIDSVETYKQKKLKELSEKQSLAGNQFAADMLFVISNKFAKSK
jgi:hypothetical protein